MSEFTHSMVLFTGDDGLPLEFNIRNTREKAKLKGVIEYGGGLCSTSENAVHLISPGTKVLNAASGKRLVSTRYIFDCIEEDYLLDVDNYIVTVEEASQPVMSDEDSPKEKCKKSSKKNIRTINYSCLGKLKSKMNESASSVEIGSFQSPNNSALNIGDCLNTLKEGFSSSPDIQEDESMDISNNENGQKIFVSPSPPLVPNNISKDESTGLQKNSNINNSSTASFIAGSIDFDLEGKARGGCSVPWSSTAKDLEVKPSDNSLFTKSSSDVESNDMILYPSSQPLQPSSDNKDVIPALNSQRNGPFLNIEKPQSINIEEEEMAGRADSPSNVQVSSSQSEENNENLDEYDRVLLFLAKTNSKKEKEEDKEVGVEKLSQSFSVSSSADAQVSKPNSQEVDAVSSSQEEKVFDPQAYMKKLEDLVSDICKKSSPLSISEKTTLVKYICIVEKCSPSDAINRLNGV